MAGLEIWGPRDRQLVELVDPRYVVGTADDMDIVVTGDGTVSAVHAAIEQIGQRWFVHDLDSRNGTYVNKERLLGERALRDGDEIVMGKSRLVFFAQTARKDPTTDTLAPPPDLTPRQMEILVELCRPRLQGNAFTQPASVRDIAGALFTTAANVKQHLEKLYEKFDIPSYSENRRVALANEAVQRGAVTMSDLRQSDEP